jgi:hypothetical protein
MKKSRCISIRLGLIEGNGLHGSGIISFMSSSDSARRRDAITPIGIHQSSDVYPDGIYKVKVTDELEVVVRKRDRLWVPV